MLVGPSKCLIQIIQIKLNRVKNPNRPETNQLAILQAWPRIWTRDYREQIQLTVRAGLELGASELQVQRSNRSAIYFLMYYSNKQDLGVSDENFFFSVVIS